MPAVLRCWAAAGYEAHPLGTESDTDALRQALGAQSDPTSRMLRFRPDRVLVKRGTRSVLCEVKSEDRGRPNFAVEVDSWLAAQMWNSAHRHVCYAFADFAGKRITACWAGDLPKPTKVFVPKRNGWPQVAERLRGELPGVFVDPVAWGGGSGTAYFLVPKASKALVPLADFIRECI